MATTVSITVAQTASAGVQVAETVRGTTYVEEKVAVEQWAHLWLLWIMQGMSLTVWLLPMRSCSLWPKRYWNVYIDWNVVTMKVISCVCHELVCWLNTLLTQLQDITSLTQHVKNQALNTLEKARKNKHHFETNNKKLKDFIQKIRGFLMGKFTLFWPLFFSLDQCQLLLWHISLSILHVVFVSTFLLWPLLSRGGSRSREHREGGSAGLVHHTTIQQNHSGQNDHADKGQPF